MPTVTVLGLGNMGGALAGALIDAGHDVTAWNRGAARRAAFADRCRVEEDVAVAIGRSDLVVGILADYQTTRAVLDAPAASGALHGRTLVQLASGSPAEARELAAWAAAQGATVLDGKIFTFPSRIGDPETMLAYAGPAEAYARHLPVLEAFGGRPAHVGEDAGGAAAVDLAWLSFLYGATIGLLQGVAFCDAEGVDPAAAFAAVPSWLVELAAESSYYERLIRRGDYAGDQASLDVHLAAMQHILGSAEATGVSTGLPRLLVEIASAAVARGHGAEEIAAAVEVLRAPRA